jgi:BTB/POZ domain
MSSEHDNKRQGSGDEEGTGKKLRKDVDLVYGSDDELPKESIFASKWRTDDPLADWKIVITVKSPEKPQRDDDDDNKKPQGGGEDNKKDDGDADAEEIKKENAITTYSVRKCLLADGDRRSDYFVLLFENDGKFSESKENTSHIEVDHELQAKAFPAFLDYLYSVGLETPEEFFNAENATALYSLAKYFGVKRLANEAKKFCLQDMQNGKTCGTYYEHATILQTESIMKPAVQSCRDYFKDIVDPRTCALHRVADHKFFLELMEDSLTKGTIGDIQWHLAAHVAAYCETHAAVTSPENFLQLTDKKYLPASRIKGGWALSLLSSDRRILGNHAVQQVGGDGELSDLQIRCVEAIARDKKVFLQHMSCLYNHFKHFSPVVQQEILKALIKD